MIDIDKFTKEIQELEIMRCKIVLQEAIINSFTYQELIVKLQSILDTDFKTISDK